MLVPLSFIILKTSKSFSSYEKLKLKLLFIHTGYSFTTVNCQQLSGAGLFKYVWPFSGHQALKG